MQKLAKFLLFWVPSFSLYTFEFMWADSFNFWALTVPETMLNGSLLLILNLTLPLLIWKLPWYRSFPKNWKWLFWLVTVLISTSPWRHARGPDGDAPHYLIGSYSLYKDGDLDLSNNYAASSQQYYYFKQAGGWQLPDTRTTQDKVGAQRLWYLPGVSLINAPLSLVRSSFLVNLFLAVFIALGLSAIWVITSGHGPLKAICLLSAPIFAYTVQVFPDPYGFTLVCLFFYEARFHRYARACLWLGCLIWLKPAFFSIACLLCGYLFITSFESKRWTGVTETMRGLPVFLGLIAALVIFNWYAWGRINLLGAHPDLSRADFSYLHLKEQLPLFFFGLGGGAFLLCPVLLFFLWQPIRINSLSKLVLVMTCASYIFFLGCFPWAEGGWSPRGRYLLVLLPAFLLGIDYSFLGRQWLSRASLSLSFLAFIVVCIYPDAEMPFSGLGYPFSLLTAEKFWMDVSSKNETLSLLVGFLGSTSSQVFFAQTLFVLATAIMIYRLRSACLKELFAQIRMICTDYKDFAKRSSS